VKVWLLLSVDGEILVFDEPPKTRKGFLSTVPYAVVPVPLWVVLDGEVSIEEWDRAGSRMAYKNHGLPRVAPIPEAVEWCDDASCGTCRAGEPCH